MNKISKMTSSTGRSPVSVILNCRTESSHHFLLDWGRDTFVTTLSIVRKYSTISIVLSTSQWVNTGRQEVISSNLVIVTLIGKKLRLRVSGSNIRR